MPAALLIWPLSLFSIWWTWRAYKTGVIKGGGIKISRDKDLASFQLVLFGYGLVSVFLIVVAFINSINGDRL